MNKCSACGAKTNNADLCAQCSLDSATAADAAIAAAERARKVEKPGDKPAGESEDKK